MGVATFHASGRAAEGGIAARAHAVARLVTVTAAHALYAKSQVGAPVHALRRAHTRSEASLNQKHGEEQQCNSLQSPETEPGIAMARPLVRPNARAGSHATTRAELLATLDLLESTLDTMLEAAMRTHPTEHQVDIVLLFGPGLLFPKQIFCITILLPSQFPVNPLSASLSQQPEAPCLSSKPQLKPKQDDAPTRPLKHPLQSKSQGVPRQPSKPNLQTIERRLLAFLVEHDTDPNAEEEDVSVLATDTQDGPVEPLSLSHPSCDKIKKRAMKCHVALRASQPFVQAGVASQSQQTEKPSWMLKPSFHPRGLDVLLSDRDPGDASSHAQPQPPPGPTHFPSTHVRLPIPTTVSGSSTPRTMGSSSNPAQPPTPTLYSSPNKAMTPPPPTRPVTPHTDLDPVLVPSNESNSRTASPVSATTGSAAGCASGFISWSGCVAGTSRPQRTTTRTIRAPMMMTSPYEPATSSTPLRPAIHPPVRTSRHSPLVSVGSSPPSTESTSMTNSASRRSLAPRSRGSFAPRNGGKGVRKTKGSLWGRMRLDLRRPPPARKPVAIFPDSEEENEEREGPQPPAPQVEEPQARAWAVFAVPIFGGGVGL